LSILGFLLQALPMMNQVNGNIIALALPANVGVAVAAWLRRNAPMLSPTTSKTQRGVAASAAT
jgi:hypothetical protein